MFLSLASIESTHRDF